MIHRDIIKEAARITRWVGIAGIIYTGIDSQYQRLTYPTPLVEQHSKHQSRIRVLVNKQYLEHLTAEQEQSEIQKHRLSIQKIEQNPEYPTQKSTAQYRNDKISENTPVLLTSIGLLTVAGIGYYTTREKKKKIEAPYKLEFS